MVNIELIESHKRDGTIIVPISEQVEFYKSNRVGIIDLSRIGPRSNQILEGYIDITNFSNVHKPAFYWTRGRVFTESSDLRLVIASEHCEMRYIPDRRRVKTMKVPYKEILDGFGIKLGDPRKRGEWGVDLISCFRS